MHESVLVYQIFISFFYYFMSANVFLEKVTITIIRLKYFTVNAKIKYKPVGVLAWVVRLPGRQCLLSHFHLQSHF